jgi:hypothetical protein
MLFSGNSFRLTPEANQMGFVFSGISLDGTGVAELGFSGQSNILKFFFNNNRIFANDGKFIGTYNQNEPFTLNGFVDTGRYQVYLDGGLVANRKPKTDFTIQRFYVKTTGINLSSDVRLYCDNIPFTLSAAESFSALTSLTGSICNESAINFRVFRSSLTFYQSTSDLLSGNITGNVTGNYTGLSFALTDGNASRFDSQLRFILSLDTSIGPMSGTFSSNRVSGLDFIVRKLTTNSTGVVMSGLFDGTGRLANRFIFSPVPQSSFLNYYASVSDLRGQQQSKSFNVKIENLSHTDGQAYKSEYVTGFTLTNSGEYLKVPTAKFTGYYFVSGLDWNLNTMILSSGCTGNIPVTFSGLGGLGASGEILAKRTFLSGVYGNSINIFYLPYQFNLLSGGTGYLQVPTAFIFTGKYPNCFDVAKNSGNASIYVPFSGSGLLVPRAAFLTGEVLYRTGLVSGGQLTGYIVTGLEITNPGSGYSSIFLPRMSFVRQAEDTLITGATGAFSMKASGAYSLTGNWSVKTGVSNTNLAYMTGTSGVLNLLANENYFTVQVNFSGIDNTEPLATKVTVSMVGGSTIIHNVSGIKYYDTTTGFLKKKNNLEATRFVVGSLLSFSLSQSELDDYYSSNEFVNNSFTVDYGDLDF